jgi:uncharacterized protein involved in outer membrane biogenesis
MRYFSRIFLAFFFIATALLVAAYIFVQINGHRMLTQKLNDVFVRPVTIGDVRLSFPLGLRIDDFKMEGAIAVKEVRIHFGILSLVRKTWHISSLALIDPVLTLERTAEKGVSFAEPPQQEASAAPEAVASGGQAEPPLVSSQVAQQFTFIVDNMLIRGGRISYADRSSEKGIKLRLKDLELFAKDLALSKQSLNTKYNLTAVLADSPLNFSGSRVESSGWINWHERNMDAELVLTDIAEQVALKAGLRSKNNDMTVKGKINIANLTGARSQPQEGAQASLQDLIFEGLQSSGVAITMDFQFATKMDNFQLGTVAVSGNVDYQQPKKSVIEDFKNIGKQFGEIGKKPAPPAAPATPAPEEAAPDAAVATEAEAQ